jgi:nickel/cobalt transporter (NiCoT) family protein
LISLGVRSLDGPVKEGHSTLHQATGLLGSAVSGGILYLISAIVSVLLGIVKVFREMKTGRYDETGLERQLENRGLMNRLFGRVTKISPNPTICTRSACCSAWGSTPRAKSPCW